MAIIKNIERNKDYIEMEVEGKYIYKIPTNNDYVRNLFNKGIKANKILYKDINYYNKCSLICLFPIWLSVGLMLYGLITNFVLMDLVLICCAGMSALSLIGTGIFKIASNISKNKANNNEYFIKIYEYALTGKKDKNYQTNNIKQDVKNTRYSKKSNEIIQDIPIKRNDNQYHLTSGEIIQDEIIHSRKGR